MQIRASLHCDKFPSFLFNDTSFSKKTSLLDTSNKSCLAPGYSFLATKGAHLEHYTHTATIAYILISSHNATLRTIPYITVPLASNIIMQQFPLFHSNKTFHGARPREHTLDNLCRKPGHQPFRRWRKAFLVLLPRATEETKIVRTGDERKGGCPGRFRHMKEMIKTGFSTMHV